MTAAVWIAIAVYGALGLVVAWMSRRGMGGGLAEYYLAGRRVGGVVSALSYGATTYSAFMMVGLVGLTYAGGVGALGFELIYLAGLGLVVIFGPRFWLIGRERGHITPAEMLGDRYDSRLLAGLVALASCVFLIPYSAVQLMGIGYLLSGVSDDAIPFSAGILIGGAFTLIWTLAAGLRSVLWTDVLQVAIMLVTSLVALGFVVTALGGPGAFIDTVEAGHGEWLAVPGPGLFDFVTFVGLTLPWLFFSISNPQVSQRLFTTRSLGAMRTMIIGFLVLGFVYTLISVLWGFAAVQLVPGLEQADLATPRLLRSGAVPVGVAVILMVGIMAAAVSTVDSILLALASMVSRDVYRPLIRAGRGPGELAAGKAVVLAVTAVALGFAYLRLDLISILSVASSIGLLVTVPAIVGAFFWRRGTAAGAVTSVAVAGTAVTVLQLTGYDPLGVPVGIWSLVLATALFVGVSYATEPPAARAAIFIDDVDAALRRHRIR
ncbi:sodium:solute symporter family protein [Aquisalimonas lutea]|uniref:sodium:solute symporter family protein n=1 Tax=Aquisalimonas lutea TaxID=1327750 RepID=UPI0025B5601F|nr:sodium:solute symporter family protein [Aquisalimonas lutea]MDN3519161.1 sodium:solute symporter family protein [Aquisalimonas lutea]